MNKLLLVVSALAALVPPLQGAPGLQSARKTGAIYKDEVDQLIDGLKGAQG